MRRLDVAQPVGTIFYMGDIVGVLFEVGKYLAALVVIYSIACCEIRYPG